MEHMPFFQQVPYGTMEKPHVRIGFLVYFRKGASGWDCMNLRHLFWRIYWRDFSWWYAGYWVGLALRRPAFFLSAVFGRYC